MYLFGYAGSLSLYGPFSSCSEQGLLWSQCMHGLHGGNFPCYGTQALEFLSSSSCGAWDLLPCGMWGLPDQGSICVSCTGMSACLVSKSCQILWDPMNYSSPGSFSHGVSQARILEQVSISFSRESSWSRDWTCISCIAGRFFTTEPPGKATT